MRETWVRREQLMEGVAVIALLLGKRAGVGRTPNTNSSTYSSASARVRLSSCQAELQLIIYWGGVRVQLYVRGERPRAHVHHTPPHTGICAWINTIEHLNGIRADTLICGGGRGHTPVAPQHADPDGSYLPAQQMKLWRYWVLEAAVAHIRPIWPSQPRRV